MPISCHLTLIIFEVFCSRNSLFKIEAAFRSAKVYAVKI